MAEWQKHVARTSRQASRQATRKSRGPSAKTVLNRACLDAIDLGLAEGMEEVGKAVLARTEPPDAAPFGEGLVQAHDWAVFLGRKRVAGTAKLSGNMAIGNTGLTLVAGYGFPGRFQEFGTIHQPPRPFLTPAFLETVPGVADLLGPAVVARLRGVR